MEEHRMKRVQILCLTALVSLSLVCFGCGKKKPDGFPDVQPFTVKVVDGSKPIEGAFVQFICTQGSLAISGKTDSTGVAVISTFLQGYRAQGAPVGDYRVQVEKKPLAEHWKTPEEQSLMSKPEKDAYIDEWLAKCAELPREVPDVWSSFDNTPLTATVSAGGGEVTYDVEGKAEN